MSRGASRREVEIKLPVKDASAARRLLLAQGFRLRRRRKFEANALFDTPERSLTKAGKLLRVRRFGKDCLLTYKGPAGRGRHKVRREIEVGVAEPGSAVEILRALGFEVIFRYEKYRAEYADPDGKGLATVDETPIGVFMELEGEPEWIDRTARRLGFDESDYITETYAELYLGAGGSGDMVFGRDGANSLGGTP